MKNQKEHWNQVHNQGNIGHYSTEPTEFAKETLETLSPRSRILELGCGVGNDSAALAGAGHIVLATDFAEVAINKNRERFKNVPGLSFDVLDISIPFDFKDGEFDAVYARLSLHYFADKTTKSIFGELHRVLKPGGLLFFVCKSTEDPLYGQGEQIEPNMYEYKGHVRHFFSEDYATQCMDDNFDPIVLKSGKEKFYGYESAFIKVIAKNR